MKLTNNTSKLNGFKISLLKILIHGIVGTRGNTIAKIPFTVLLVYYKIGTYSGDIESRSGIEKASCRFI